MVNARTGTYDTALRYGIYTRQLKLLRHLDNFGGTPDHIVIAFGQAASVVEFLVNTYGPERMAALFPALQRTFDIDLALQQVYGMDQHGLDTEWRLAIGIEPLPG